METTKGNLPAGRQRYVRVNGTWPKPLPPLTEQEAMSAAKRLYRTAMGRAFRGKVVITSGNRNTWVRSGVLYVNPKDWHDLVHDLSHYCFWQLHPHLTAHDWRHAHLERQLIEMVVSKGWLDGKLRRQPKPKPDMRTVRYHRALGRIKAWESKQRRAENALKKLRKTVAYYEKGGAG